MLMYFLHHLFQGMWPGNGKYLRVCLLHNITFGTQTTRNDHLTIFRKCFTYGIRSYLAAFFAFLVLRAPAAW